MDLALYLASFLAITIGVVHSYLGERYILTRLFRRNDLPKLFGDTGFTIRTLRFAWHITTIAWWGFAVILILLAQPNISKSSVGLVIGCTFLVHFAIALFASKGKHLSWIVFLTIGVLSIYATQI